MPRFKWIIEDRLAVSPMPLPTEIEALSRIFTHVVVLIEEHEYVGGGIHRYLDAWRSRGVDVYYCPTRDFWFPPLLELVRLTRWIHEAVNSGGRVLVHCMGGLGRSGVVTASYLVYSHRISGVKAITEVRRINPGSLEEPRQEKIVIDYHVLLNLIDKDSLGYIVDMVWSRLKDYGDEDTFKHLSKVTQLAVEAATDLGLIVGVSERDKARAVLAAILHDVVPPRNPRHGVLSAEHAENILSRTRYRDIAHEVGMLIRCHHVDWCRDRDGASQAILWLADYLDHGFRGSVDYIEINGGSGGSIVIGVHCALGCSDEVSELEGIKKLLEDILGRRITVRVKPF